MIINPNFVQHRWHTRIKFKVLPSLLTCTQFERLHPPIGRYPYRQLIRPLGECRITPMPFVSSLVC